MIQYFSKTCSLNKDELDLPNYVTKSNFFKKNNKRRYANICLKDWINLKSDADKLDISKLHTVPKDLRNLKSDLDKSDVEKLKLIPIDLTKLNIVDIVKKTACDE